MGLSHLKMVPRLDRPRDTKPSALPPRMAQLAPAGSLPPAECKMVLKPQDWAEDSGLGELPLLANSGWEGCPPTLSEKVKLRPWHQWGKTPGLGPLPWIWAAHSLPVRFWACEGTQGHGGPA